MNKNLLSGIAATTFVASLAFAAPASAAVTFNADSGTGFVGKGDVQLTLNWNNKQLQDMADGVEFAVQSTEVKELSWVCINNRSEQTVQRETITTTTTQGVIDAVARDSKKQITGFNINGYVGTPTTATSTDGGLAVNQCPGQNSSLYTEAGDPVEISSSQTLTLTHPKATGTLAI